MKYLRIALQLSLDFLIARPNQRRLPHSSVLTTHSDKELQAVWTKLQLTFFPERSDIANYRVKWSKRRHRYTLASCNIEKNRIIVAPAMGLPEAAQFLEPLLYHEMCHAVLGRPKRINGRRVIHGQDFKVLEKRHEGIKELDKWIKQGGWAAVCRQFNMARSRNSKRVN